MDEAAPDLFDALWRLDCMLRQRGFAQRLRREARIGLAPDSVETESAVQGSHDRASLDREAASGGKG